MDVVPQPFHEVISRVNDKVKKNDSAFASRCQELISKVDLSRMEDDHVKKSAALIDVIEELAI
jgi:hypothetical protein